MLSLIHRLFPTLAGWPAEKWLALPMAIGLVGALLMAAHDRILARRMANHIEVSKAPAALSDRSQSTR